MTPAKKSIVASVVENGISLVGLRGLGLISSVITNIFLVRFLGAHGFGTFTTATNIVNICTAINLLGFGTILIREVAKNPKLTWKIFINTLYAGLALSLLCTGMGMLFFCFVTYPPLVREGTFILLASLFPAFITFIVENLYVGLEKVKSFTWINLLRMLVETLTILALLYAGGRTMAIIKLSVVFRFIFAGMIFYLISRMFERKSLRINLRFITVFMKQTVAFSLIGILTGLIFRIDVLFLTKLSGEWATGIYSAAYKIIFMSGGIMNSFIHAFYPVASRGIKELPPEKFQSLCRRAMNYLMVVVVVAVVGVVGFSREIVAILYGQEFAKSAETLRILALFFIPMCGTAFLGAMLAVGNYQKYDLLALALATLSALGLHFYLARAFSFNGSAWALVLSFGIAFAIQLVYVNGRVFKIDLRNTLAKPGLVLGISLVALYGMRSWNEWIAGSLGTMLCLALFVCFKSVKIADFKSLLAQIKTGKETAPINWEGE